MDSDFKRRTREEVCGPSIVRLMFRLTQSYWILLFVIDSTMDGLTQHAARSRERIDQHHQQPHCRLVLTTKFKLRSWIVS